MPTPMTVSTIEAAETIGVNIATVRRLIDNGYLERVPGIRNIRITRASLNTYLDAATNQIVKG